MKFNSALKKTLLCPADSKSIFYSIHVQYIKGFLQFQLSQPRQMKFREGLLLPVRGVCFRGRFDTFGHGRGSPCDAVRHVEIGQLLLRCVDCFASFLRGEQLNQHILFRFKQYNFAEHPPIRNIGKRAFN